MNAENTTWRPRIGLALAIAIAIAGPAEAGTIDRTVPLEPGGSVNVEIPSGALIVQGWDRPEVRVTGEWNGAADALAVRGQGDRVRIEIEPSGRGRERADLTVHVPRLAELAVEVLACDVDLRDVHAERVRLEVVHGDVSVDATVGRLDLEAVSGRIAVGGEIEDARIESAAGGVRVAGLVGSVDIETVSGPLDVSASAPLREVALSSASGAITFEGALAADGELRAETLNGDIELRLDGATRASAEIETFNGTVDVDWPGVEVAPDRDGPGAGRTARFRLGGDADGGARIHVETFNGSCTIRRR